MRRTSFRKTLFTGAAAVTIALGGSLLMAPSASAVGSSACTKNIADETWNVTNPFRSTIQNGPGYSYANKEELYAGAPFRVYCKTKKSGITWYYGKHLNGGIKGWLDHRAFGDFGT
ncbi:SH3 domain-containing protein [Streptomyces sp. NPDC003006]